jgi:hypothetical protein
VADKSDNRVQRYMKRVAALSQQREELLPEWRDIAQNYCPRSLPYLLDKSKDANRRARRNKFIINTHPVTAARTHQRGMTAGIASPARPWFRLRAPDRDLNKFAPVSAWLHETQQILEDLFSRSNFYNAVGVCYGEEGKFGTLALGMFEDQEDDLRCISYPIGSYLIAANAAGRCRTFIRTYRPTAEQIVEEFAMTDPTGVRRKKPDFSRISHQVQTAYENSSTRDQEFDVVHVLEPNYDRAGDFVDSKNMAFRSCYYEPSQAAQGVMLKESGFEEHPVKVARWDVTGEDAWGSGPGLDALGDAKGLQDRERAKAKRIDKHNDPALVGHPDLKNKPASLMSGDVTYVGFTANGGQPQLRAIHDVSHDISSLLEDIDSIQRRISRVWDEDLFLMLSMSETKDVTAEAIARKHEEKVVMLGPVLERQNDELFDPAIDRAFSIAARRGLLPEPPEELEGMPLKVEYVSLLAQAQRMVSAGSIDRMVGMIGGLAKVQADAGEAPDIFDKIDFDQVVDEYAEALGTMPTIIRSDEQVAELRANRQRQQQAQALAAAAKPVSDGAKAAKDLSETQVNGESALDRMAQAR